MRSTHRDMAWKAAAKMAELAKALDDREERQYYKRMRDAWMTLANRCEFDPPRQDSADAPTGRPR